ncbi:secondary thiamine-phosphate synthase enzyme YjbQ [Saccharicrinis aurantiacus]|uniref:secondary thiamine-phosphate synthase enzyme YjbQ n=1 Tax=Saccharicrinis aurantiacus TaxID=1849719 RepID=UPI0024930431|nr:secondary thiamine-phosphate synthase enzyme YjbQ [Saccharicrinis aurantiacus]
MIDQLEIRLPEFRRGFHLITDLIESRIKLPQTGMLNLFVQHTSAGLTINENADPSVRTDFETIFNKLIPENDPDYVHTLEGSDDMPAHVKSTLAGPSLTIPISKGRLNLGTWQGIYFCEFRNYGGPRKMVATVYS